MCLTKRTAKYGPNDNMVVGYKVFKCYDWMIRGVFYGGPYSKGRVYTAIVEKLHADYRNHVYDSGFHIYESLQDAKNAARWDTVKYVYEVHGWDIRTTGVQNNCNISVAQNMRIIRRVP